MRDYLKFLLRIHIFCKNFQEILITLPPGMLEFCSTLFGGLAAYIAPLGLFTTGNEHKLK